MKPRHIEIEWIDSASARAGGWHYVNEWETKPATCLTVGILVKETKKNLMIASTVATTGQIHAPHVVPKCAIVRRRDGAELKKWRLANG